MTRLKNWAGNYQYSTNHIHYPESIEQLQEIVRQSKHLRVLGTRHSFNGIADSTENLISLERLPKEINILPEQRKVTISANVRYGELARTLHPAGFALPNLGSLPHISVVGACTTATHGSGDQNQNLAAAVSGMEMINAEGERVVISGEVLPGAVVSLGGLGVIVRFTLDLLPTFELRQYVFEKLPIAHLDAHFDAIMASAYSVSLFTDWQGDFVNQVWLKTKAESAPEEFYGAKAATRQRHPIDTFSGDACTQQLGVPGAWHERLPHFRFDATPSAGNELQSEYFIPRKDAVAAIQAIRSLGDEIAPYLLVSEIRSIAADHLWLSPCYQQDSIAIHFTWKLDWAAVSQLLPKIEALLAPFKVRPHWGKLFTMPVESCYEKLPQFRELIGEYDPQGKFRNAYLDEVIFESGKPVVFSVK